MPNCEYVQKYYKVPACIGRGVLVGGKPGVIAEDRGAYIGVLFDTDKPNSISPCHPTSQVEYGEMREVRQMTRSQRRYRDYVQADLTCTFGEYLKYGIEGYESRDYNEEFDHLTSLGFKV